MQQLTAYSFHDLLRLASGFFGALLRELRDNFVMNGADYFNGCLLRCTAASQGSRSGQLPRAGVRGRGGWGRMQAKGFAGHRKMDAGEEFVNVAGSGQVD